MNRQYYVYIMASPNNRVLYTGVTGNLVKRVEQHKSKHVEGFTKKYNVTKLVYFEIAEDPLLAIEREKRIKGGSRLDKLDLVQAMNPKWRDLSDGL